MSELESFYLTIWLGSSAHSWEWIRHSS